nr:MAG TPA: hypothetical protein [Caudoviricetes sp.]
MLHQFKKLIFDFGLLMTRIVSYKYENNYTT